MTPALNLIRTTTFRLTVIYAGLFGASAITILIFLYWASIGFMERQTDETLMAELQGLEEQYRQRGLAGVNRLIVSRSARGDENLYLLLAPSGRMISGNLNAPPKGAYSSEGWIDFNYNRPVYDELGRPAGTAARAARARRVAVQGQYTLIVGRDIDDLRRIERAMKTALAWAAALTLILGLGGGVILSRNMLRRLDQVNQTSRRIMAGDLSHRIAVSGTGDELDQLAGNLNAMLDQIEQLMNGLKEVGDNIAHDLRSPLTRLRNRLDVTLMGESDEAGLRDALRKTIDDADGLLETLNALLNIARIESGSQRDSLKPLDLGDLAQDLVDLYTPVAQDAGYELLSEISDDLFIKGAKQLISQALSNLVDNALKYGGGGRVMIAAHGEGERIVLQVSDEGPGVDTNDRERLTDRFTQLEQSRSTQGSGLGLSLVAAIAKLHNAELTFVDTSLPPPRRGRGLTVSLIFPASTQKSEQ